MVAAGVGSVDGWRVWIVEPSGRPLDSIRQDLLDQAAESPDGEAGELPGDQNIVRTRHAWLKDARSQAETGAPVEISVRALLARWGNRSRGHKVSRQIEADLANHGLVTAPDFRKVSLDAVLHLITIGSTDAPSPDPDEGEVDELDVGITVGNLPSALRGVVSVTPSATFDEAITLMLLNDYSQLAVLAGKHQLHGAVSWKSIAKVQHANPNAVFADAVVEAHVVPYDQELIDTLPRLAEADYVFVRDDRNAVAGIVTTADVVLAYGELATPFFLIGELDRVLRKLIAKTFLLGDVTALCDPGGSRKVASFDDLGMGDYQRVLENPGSWAKLGWPLDRTAFIKRLDEIREIRNDVMHFNPDPLPEDAVNKVRHMLKLLRGYRD